VDDLDVLFDMEKLKVSSGCENRRNSIALIDGKGHHWRIGFIPAYQRNIGSMECCDQGM
jgi:hypothetical protein